MTDQADPVELMFQGMAKLGPGSDHDTISVLRSLPSGDYSSVVDAGAGAGRQTLALARSLATVVHAVDASPVFLARLEQAAASAGLTDRVKTHCMDMARIPECFTAVDLLWSEGSAYNIGFLRALEVWRPCLTKQGLLVAIELCWLGKNAPEDVRTFFANAYPEMRGVDEHQEAIQKLGYTLIGLHTLPSSAWRDDYYDVLEPRARELVKHEDEKVRAIAQETLDEINAFALNDGSYGYVFFKLARR